MGGVIRAAAIMIGAVAINWVVGDILRAAIGAKSGTEACFGQGMICLVRL